MTRILTNMFYAVLLSPSLGSLQEFYSENPKTCDDYGRIINQRQFKRIMGLMEGCTVAYGGDADEAQGYIGKWFVLYKFNIPITV